MLNVDELLNKQDTYSMMLLLLFASSDNPRYATLNELPFILDDPEQFKKFIKYYAGQTIELPTIQELTDALRLLALFQYYVIEKQDWTKALVASGFSLDETATARIKLNAFKNQLEKYNYRLGGLLQK